MTEIPDQGQRSTWRSLTFQLLAIVVFPLIVLILAVTYISTTLHNTAMRQLVGDRDERAARMAATAITDQVQHRANEIRLAGSQLTDPSTSGPVDTSIQKVNFLLPDFDLGIVALGADGSLLSSVGASPVKPEQLDRMRQGMAALQADPTQEVYVSKAIVPSNFPNGFMVVVAPDPDRQAFVAGAFATDPVVEHVFANGFAPDQETSVAIVSPSKELIYRKGFASRTETVTGHAGVAEALSGKAGTLYVEVEGSEHVVAYSGIQPFGWALLIEEPWEAVASPTLETTHMAPLILVPVLLLALLAVFFGIRQIVQPLQALAMQSSRLGVGEYTAIEKPVGGVSEIQQLQHELIRMAHKVRTAQQSLHSYIGAITSGQEEERRRLARELHDDTIQSLIAFKQRLQLVEMDWEDHPVANTLKELEHVAEQTIENLRRMISALRPIYLEDLGLIAALEMLVSETGEQMQSGVEFSRQGKERRLESSIELALYRIVQEALSNITRHSGASHAAVQMEFLPDGVRISVEDNGKGFVVPGSPAEFAPSGHFGLLGMFERADLIGGEMEIASTPGKGTSLVILAPYDPSDAKRKSSESKQSSTSLSLTQTG